MALTPKQQLFVTEYLIDLNATQAAVRAGYSEKTAASQGERLLRNVEIQGALTVAMQARADRLELTADAVIKELMLLAFSDMRSFTTWGPNGVVLRDSAILPAEAAACVAEVSETTGATGGGSLRFKLHSKTAALELLGRHLGIFKDVKEVRGRVIVKILRGRSLSDL